MRDSDQQALASTRASLIVFLVLIVVFLFWFARATRNLQALSTAEPRYGVAAAVIAWFIPFVALVRPKKAANDAWRAGAGPGTAVDAPAPAPAPSPA